MSCLKTEYVNKRIYVWNTNKGSLDAFSELAFRGINVEGFVVKEKEDVTIMNRPLVTLEEITKDDDYVIAVSKYANKETLSFSQKYNMAIAENMVTDDTIYHTGYALQFHMLDKAIKEKRKIAVYEADNLPEKWTEHILNMYGIEIDTYIEDVFDFYLEYPNVDEYLFVVNDMDHEKRYDVMEGLLDIGVKRRDIISFQGYRYLRTGEANLLPDSLIGISKVKDYPKRKYPGIAVLGDEKENDIRILVLGGSTSAENLFPSKTWAAYLYDELKHQGIDVTVYNAAHPKNRVPDEILRYLRDGQLLNPHIVISMSGLNDIVNKERDNLFYISSHYDWLKAMHVQSDVINEGLKSDEEVFPFWVRQEKNLKALVEAAGSEFYCFLQPTNYVMENKTMEERLMFEIEGCMLGVESYVRNHSSDDIYVDLLFEFCNDNWRDMYIDSCHYSEKGSKTLADIVLNTLKKSKFFNF